MMILSVPATVAAITRECRLRKLLDKQKEVDRQMKECKRVAGDYENFTVGQRADACQRHGQLEKERLAIRREIAGI